MKIKKNKIKLLFISINHYFNNLYVKKQFLK